MQRGERKTQRSRVVPLVAVAAVTVALVAPKKTTLLAAVVLKPVPAMVTGVPTNPLEGVKEKMTGAWPKATPVNNTVNNKIKGSKFFLRYKN